MKQQYEMMLYISILEDEIATQMKVFEESVRARWKTLSKLKNNTIYHMCPYFDEIHLFFEFGIMRITHDVCRRFSEFSGKTLELSWFHVCSNYYDLLEGYCNPFAEAFEAASSGGLNRLRQARLELERNSSDRVYGYVTNSFTYMLAAETVNAIASAMKTIERDNQAWKVATAPQQAMHNKLSSLWIENFESAFMKKIEVENALVTQEIIEQMCFSINITYDMYVESKKCASFSVDKEQLIVAQNKARDMRLIERKKIQDKIIDDLKNEITLIDAELSNLGFALWGDNGKRRRKLKMKKTTLSLEVNATVLNPPLPESYVFTFLIDSPESEKFMNAKLDSDFYKKTWNFIYSHIERHYVAYSPNNESIFIVDGDFLTGYGHSRTFCGRIETSCMDSYVHEIGFALFDLDD